MGIFSQKGFTLLELITVVLIIGILSSLGTLGFRTMRDNAQIDRQARELYADLMKARADALFKKTERSAKLVSATQFAVYPNGDCSDPPIVQKTFSAANPVQSNDANPLAFDSTGVASVAKAYCVGPTGNSAGVDSVVVSTTSVMLGKLTGGACSSANIEPK
jgi:prepilin-type N-terminal cleavage/methylation domain-containing protein